MNGTPDKLHTARITVDSAAAYGEYKGAAQADLDAARRSLMQAETAFRKGRPRREVENLAYAAEQLAMAAMARYESMLLQDKNARSSQAAMALHKAETAEQEAAWVRRLVQPSQPVRSADGHATAH